MKKLVWILSGALVATLSALLVLGLLASGIPETEPVADPPPAGPTDEAASDSGLVDVIAGMLGLDPKAAGTTYRLLEEVVQRGEAEVTAPELADIVHTALSGAPDGRAFLSAAEPPRVRYDDDRVEIGSVVELSRLDERALSADARDAVERIRSYAPFLANRPIWVAIDSAPFAWEGDIDLGTNASFRIGRLPLPGFLARALGLDEQLREALMLDLRFLNVQEVVVRGDHLYLRATPASR